MNKIALAFVLVLSLTLGAFAHAKDCCNGSVCCADKACCKSHRR